MPRKTQAEHITRHQKNLYDDQILSVEKTVELINKHHLAYMDLYNGKIKNSDKYYLLKTKVTDPNEKGEKRLMPNFKNNSGY